MPLRADSALVALAMASLAVIAASAAETTEGAALADVPGLVARYRADHAALDADGALVALEDLGPGGHRLVAGARAPRVVTVAGGARAVRFAGDENALVTDLDWSAHGFTAIVVAAFATIREPAIRDNPFTIDTPGQALVGDGGSAGLALGLCWNGRAGLPAGIGEADAAVAIEAPHPDPASGDLVVRAGDLHVLAWTSATGRADPSANAWDCRLAVDLAVDDAEAAAPLRAHISTQAMNGGRRLQVGGAGERERFVGDVAEVLVFDRALPAGERARVIAALRAAHGVRAAVERLPASPVTIAPTLDDGTFAFRERVDVELATSTPHGVVRYTTDGTDPSDGSPAYAGAIALAATTEVRARAFADGRAPGPIASARFTRWSPPAPSATPLPAGWKRSWGDEFTGPGIDRSVWGFELGYVRNSEAQFYSDRRENSFIEDGCLVIRALHDGWQGHAWTSASRSTENNVRLTYGRYELRAKIDPRSGSWPAWWLWSRPDAAGWPKEGEIDMMEYYTRKCLFNTVDGNGVFTSRKRALAALGGDAWARQFHVWTMEWDADRIDLLLDGTLMLRDPVAKFDGTGSDGANPFRTPQTKKIVLNQALGGTCGGPLRAEDAPFELRVDWLRVHVWSEGRAYPLRVSGGVGSGPYVVGTTASITAKPAPVGWTFDRWEGAPAGAVDDPARPSALVAVPAADVTVTALYRRVP